MAWVAKFFVKADGDTIVMNRGVLSDIDIRRIQNYIKDNHEAMFEMWSKDSGHGYYGDSI